MSIRIFGYVVDDHYFNRMSPSYMNEFIPSLKYANHIVRSPLTLYHTKRKRTSTISLINDLDQDWSNGPFRDQKP